MTNWDLHMTRGQSPAHFNSLEKVNTKEATKVSDVKHPKQCQKSVCVCVFMYDPNAQRS